MRVRQCGGKQLGFGLCGALMLVAAGAAWADDANPFIGRWHWDQAQSKLPPGEPAPADMILDFSRVDSLHVRWSVTTTDAQQRKSTETYDTPANGEFYPIDSATTAAFRLSGTALQATFKGPAGETDTMNCALSSDQRKMTCRGTLTSTDGKTATYLDVYDRD
jgi:hypothetical protein